MKYVELKAFLKVNSEEYIFDLIELLFDEHDMYDIYDHSELTAVTASLIAQTFDLDKEKALLAGYVHDLGRAIDVDEYIPLLEKRNISISDDERAVPSCLHGKVSSIICSELLDINDEDILEAVNLHTALKDNPSDFTKMLFLADKATWENEELHDLIHTTLTQSLNVTCYHTLDWLIATLKERNQRVFKDTEDAYNYFKKFIIL